MWRKGFFVLLVLAVPGLAQTDNAGTASIAGRITRGDQSVVRMLVTAQPANQFNGWNRAELSVRTDSDGQYRLTGLKAGNYLVTPHVLTDVLVSEGSPFARGKTVLVQDGEDVEGVDFTVIPGGVITGTITDNSGKPAISQEVTLLQYFARNNQGERPTYFAPILYKINRTDDRGVYRIFGLPRGKYLVCVGDVNPTTAPVYLPPTYYPGVLQENQAKAVEVSAGDEVTGIDIRLRKTANTYAARGRIVDTTTGAPLAGVQIRAVVVKGEEGQFGLRATERTNQQGEFQFQGLRPGRHVAHLDVEEGAEYYSDAVSFEVLNEDVNGLELKAARGGSINGSVVIMGTNDSQSLARLPTFSVSLHRAVRNSVVPPAAFVRLNPDGSFRLTGLRPGPAKLALSWNVVVPGPRPFLLRVEKGTTDVTEGVSLQAGEHVTGVRMIVAYGTGRVRGQLNFVGGELPPGTLVHIALRKVSGAVMQDYRMAQVDVQGRFQFEGLLAGEHQLVVNLPTTLKLSAAVRQQFLAQHTITVAANAETPVTFTVDLRDAEK
ncbi:MAG: hypothetical protein JNM09_21005 [Blastocatellia bacterium]|nr:hypothetical protein [Blastocatellia bacterium]